MNAALCHPRPPSRPSIDFSHINRVARRSSGPLATTGRNLRSVHYAINGLLPGAEKMSHSAAKAMTWRDAAVRRRKSATSIASSCAC
jgi:hypothetical protein